MGQVNRAHIYKIILSIICKTSKMKKTVCLINKKKKLSIILFQCLIFLKLYYSLYYKMRILISFSIHLYSVLGTFE